MDRRVFGRRPNKFIAKVVTQFDWSLKRYTNITVKAMLVKFVTNAYYTLLQVLVIKTKYSKSKDRVSKGVIFGIERIFKDLFGFTPAVLYGLKPNIKLLQESLAATYSDQAYFDT